MADIIPANSFNEVITWLEQQHKLHKGTVILTDFDNTLVSFSEQKLSMLALRPEEIPNDTLILIDRVRATGAQIAVTTNRPAEGFGPAEAAAKLLGDYPTFPDSLKERGVVIFGGGSDFWHNKYKRSDQAEYDVRSWLLQEEADGGAAIPNVGPGGVLAFVGDRPGDMAFFREVADSILAANPETVVYFFKLPGFAVEDNPLSVDTWWERVKRFIVRFLP